MWFIPLARGIRFRVLTIPDPLRFIPLAREYAGVPAFRKPVFGLSAGAGILNGYRSGRGTQRFIPLAREYLVDRRDAERLRFIPLAREYRCVRLIQCVSGGLSAGAGNTRQVSNRLRR
ncbi:hypothetical protein JT306_23420 [Salmonella enterica subsp. enterica serovar Kentucky]|nr:hypothetical protein [Salmonella enterica subsp. enterica serovar Kentucky]